MLKLNDNDYVDPHEIQSVQVAPRDKILVTMKITGDKFYVEAEYGRGIYATLDRLLDRIAAAKGDAA